MNSKEYISNFISKYSKSQTCLKENGGNLSLKEKETFVLELMKALDSSPTNGYNIEDILTALCILSREIQGSERIFDYSIMEKCIKGSGLYKENDLIVNEGYIRLLVNILFQSNECRNAFIPFLDRLFLRILNLDPMSLTVYDPYYLRMTFIQSPLSRSHLTRLLLRFLNSCLLNISLCFKS